MKRIILTKFCETPPVDKLYEDKSTRGFFGIALYAPKFEANIGTVMRSAHIFNASFVATIGRRYKDRLRTDTTQTYRHTPVFHYADFEDFLSHLPKSTDLIGVELVDRATPLGRFVHPPRGAYLFGPEDGSIPPAELKVCRYKIRLPGRISLNLAACASIVMFDRNNKCQQPE